MYMHRRVPACYGTCTGKRQHSCACTGCILSKGIVARLLRQAQNRSLSKADETKPHPQWALSKTLFVLPNPRKSELWHLHLGWHCLSALSVFHRVKDHHNSPCYSPRLKKACVRQVALDKWLPLSTTRNQHHRNIYHLIIYYIVYDIRLFCIIWYDTIL